MTEGWRLFIYNRRGTEEGHSLLKKGVAEKLFVKEGSPKSVYSFIQDAHEAGAKFYCCSPNLDLFDMTEDDLIPECEGIVLRTARTSASDAAPRLVKNRREMPRERTRMKLGVRLGL